MSGSKRVFVLAHAQARAGALKAVQEAVEGSVVTIGPEARRDSQSRHFHSLIGQIAAQVGGELSDPEDAKRILISAFRIDTRNDADLEPEWAKFGDVRMGRGLRGEVVLLGIQSRQFTVRLGASFVLWLEAFGAEAGVRFKAWESD